MQVEDELKTWWIWFLTLQSCTSPHPLLRTAWTGWNLGSEPVESFGQDFFDLQDVKLSPSNLKQNNAGAVNLQTHSKSHDGF